MKNFSMVFSYQLHMQEFSLNRFIDAQHSSYTNALQEIKNGRKRSHWMWYIFPQMKGLGFSSTSQYYGISGLEEAAAYLSHPVLGKRLIEICNTLAALSTSNASVIFGNPDDLKLHSSLTLFASLKNADPVFKILLDKFFNGNMDIKTLQLVSQ